MSVITPCTFLLGSGTYNGPIMILSKGKLKKNTGPKILQLYIKNCGRDADFCGPMEMRSLAPIIMSDNGTNYLYTYNDCRDITYLYCILLIFWRNYVFFNKKSSVCQKLENSLYHIILIRSRSEYLGTSARTANQNQTRNSSFY